MKHNETRVVVLKNSKTIAMLEKGTDIILATLENDEITIPDKAEVAIGCHRAETNVRAKFYKLLQEFTADQLSLAFTKLKTRELMEKMGRQLATDLKGLKGVFGYKFVPKNKVDELIAHLEFEFESPLEDGKE